MRKDMLLDLVHTNKKGLVGNAKATISLGCSKHETAEFRNLLPSFFHVGLQCWTFGEPTLTSSGTYLEASSGLRHCKVRGHAGQGK